MSRTRNGNFVVPFQVAFSAGLMVLIPAFQFQPARATGTIEVGPAVVAGELDEDVVLEAVVAGLIRDYRTFLREEDKRKLPSLIVDLSTKYGYDPIFVVGLIEIESSFNNQAVSVAGARGLLQIIPYVAEALADELGIPWQGPQSLHDPAINLELGLYYLRQLEQRFGSVDLALAAYNMGPSLLEQKMAQGFRPRGLYSGKINAAYRAHLERAKDLRQRMLASAL